jgi:hypothetical protein
MTTRFQLVVLDEDHIILTTEMQMSRENVHAAQEAFRLWKESGGVLIIGDCLTRDRQKVFIELDLEMASRGQSAADIMSSQGTDTPRPRGLIVGPVDDKKSGMLDRG